ncbi:hypothetical protein BS17DRAFT_405819 [Gyrodon lividus]|nr:hypothetical protein BS17DRAFT_405819 [Gyrodon lividus]
MGPEEIKPQSEWLYLDKGSHQSCPTELKQIMAYVLHLHSYWRLEGRAKLLMPSSWMELLTFKDRGCERRTKCTGDRPCPFRQVRFGGAPETGTVACDKDLSRAIVSQLLTDSGIEGSSPSPISRVFGRISGCMLRRDAETLYPSWSKVRSLDFALVHRQDGRESMAVADDELLKETARGSLLLGMKGPAHPQRPHAPSPRYNPLTLTSILKDIASHAQSQLTYLITLIQTGAARKNTEPFPEWLVLFGVVYDTEYVRIIAHMPYRKGQHDLGFASYVVDELPFCSFTEGTVDCQLILERLRIVLALMTLRRHVVRLSKFLFGDVGLSCSEGGRSNDDLSKSDGSTCSLYPLCSEAESHSHDHSAKEEGASEQCSTEYSTCLSSVYASTDLHLAANPVPTEEALSIADKRSALTDASVSRGPGGDVDRHWEDDSSSGPPTVISFCSTCSSSSDELNFSTSDSVYSERSQCTKSDGGDYMEPATMFLSREAEANTARPSELTEARWCEIIAWARQVIPTEHPVDDTYCMTIHYLCKERPSVS